MLVTSNSFCLMFQTSQLEIFIQAFYIPSRQNCLCQMSTEQKALAHLMWTELIPITWWHSWYAPVSLSPHYDCIWPGAKWAPGHQQRRALCRPSQVNSVTQSPECEGDIGSVASWVEWCFVFLSEARNLHLVCEEFETYVLTETASPPFLIYALPESCECRAHRQCKTCFRTAFKRVSTCYFHFHLVLNLKHN